MRNEFITKKKLLKKLAIKAILVILLLAGIFAFYVNQDFIMHFKPYYAKSYQALAEYRFGELRRTLANHPVGQSYSETKTASNATAVPVLLYHSIIEKPDGHNVTLANFKDQMFTLKKAGYTAISIQDFNDFVNGKRTLPEKSILITFDDGAKDSYYPVDPILEAVGFRATTFIITKYSLGANDHYYLTKKEVDNAIATGRWDVQVHTKNGHSLYPVAIDANGYFYSNKLWLADKHRMETTEEYSNRIEKDMAEAKYELESTFGIKSIGFAYPFGDFGQNKNNNFSGAKELILKNTHDLYQLAFHQSWGGASYPYSYNYAEDDTFLAKRVNVEPDWTGKDVLRLLESGNPKSLPYKDNFSADNGWKAIWGDMTTSNNALKIRASNGESGSSVYLDGTYDWKNYDIQTTMQWIKGETFGIVTNFQNENNYLTCRFTATSVVLEQKIDGKLTKLSEIDKSTKSKTSSKIHQLGMKVDNNTAACSIEGIVVTKSDKVSPTLTHGGIGFKTWDPKLNNSEAIITSVEVK